jgi:AcrR family transcriptional regulator
VANGSSEGGEESERAQRRRLPASERRITIFDAALRTFAERGYDGAPMDEIAAAAGVSKAVVYDHVASKRELYTELLDAIRLDLETVIGEALASLGPSGAPGGVRGEQRLHVAVNAFYQYVEERPEATRLLFFELEGATVSQIGLALEERVTAGVAATLGADRRLFDGHPQQARQLEMLAELLKSAVQGLASWWFRHRDTPREELVERTVALVWPAIERARGGT